MSNQFSNPGFYNADCMEAMKEFPDKFFELAIVDPPYGINAPKFNNGSGASKDKGNKYGTAVRLRSTNLLNQGGGKLRNRILNQSDCEWDASPPGHEYFTELMRVSKNQIIWGGNYFLDNLNATEGLIVWDKKRRGLDFADCEIAWTNIQQPCRIFEFMWNGMLQGDMKNKEYRIHPTQKPVALYKWILTNYAKPGDKILDTHVGSASSLIACYDLGFDYVGFEIDEEYYTQAKKRLEEEMAQVRFDL